jgi:hypothetical protein
MRRTRTSSFGANVLALASAPHHHRVVVSFPHPPPHPPSSPRSLFGIILVPLTVHHFSGAMSRRMFYSITLASAIGKLLFAGGAAWAVSTLREDIQKNRDPFGDKYPALDPSIPALSMDEELAHARDTFIWLWAIIALLVVSALHGIYAFLARPKQTMSVEARDWVERRQAEERLRGGVGMSPRPAAADEGAAAEDGTPAAAMPAGAEDDTAAAMGGREEGGGVRILRNEGAMYNLNAREPIRIKEEPNPIFFGA